jgi:arginine decarboxylase-like protein
VQGRKLPFPNKWSKYYPYKESTMEQSTNKLPKVGKGYKVGLNQAGSSEVVAALIPSSHQSSKLKMPQLVGSNS